ncbi:MAG: acyl-CoA thioesterase [Saprospiraceae bacterium]|nr:acyl-CoA thioesterase [Saprospiraceae bacterium]MBK8295860.1 acyl-CoA thioesterase [Saprospiraceae bacterium]
MTTIPQSRHRIRFKDCDPLGHLYNTRFIEYMLEAREDQILEHYQLNLMDYAEQNKKSWVLVKHEIAYLQEAKRNEWVWIRSLIIRCSEKDILVEYQMWNDEQTKLKALLWSRFLHIDLVLKKTTAHPPEIQTMLEDNLVQIEKTGFDDRVKYLSQKES